MGHVVSDISSFIRNSSDYAEYAEAEDGNYVTQHDLKRFCYGVRELNGLQHCTVLDVERAITQANGAKRKAVIICGDGTNVDFDVYINIRFSEVKPVDIDKCEPDEAEARIKLGLLLRSFKASLFNKKEESKEIKEARATVEAVKQEVEDRRAKKRREEHFMKMDAERRAVAKPDCEACMGSGTSYWCNGVYGSCLLCIAADGP